MQFKCTYRYCGRLLTLQAIEPELDDDGWSFICPVCSCKSKLVNEAAPGLPPCFVQPELEDRHNDISRDFILL